jgi:hypothetical protein
MVHVVPTDSNTGGLPEELTEKDAGKSLWIGKMRIKEVKRIYLRSKMTPEGEK